MKTFILLVIAIYFAIGIYFYLIQRSLIYYPVVSTQSDHEEEIFQNDGQQIKVTVLNQGRQQAILYFGGNAENVDYNAASLIRHFSEHTIYLVKYRGYGGSTGKPTEKGIYSDALHIYDAIKDKHQNTTVIGRSLGSAVATYVASEKTVDKLILVTPFDSILNIAQAQFPIYPMSLLLTDRHDSFSRAKKIRADTLIIAAEHDRVIDRHHSRRLAEGFAMEVDFHIIEGTGHNDISSGPGYFKVLTEFVQAL